MKKIMKAVKTIKDASLYPNPPIVSSPHKPELIVNGKKVIIFASNNYLGMMTDKRVINAAIEGAKKWGIGNGSARLLTGNLDFHLELEKQVADFKKRESALTFVSGFMVNEGCIPAICNVMDLSLLTALKLKKPKTETIIFSDEANHASIVAGVKLAGAKKEIYKHNNPDDLEEKLKKYSKRVRKLIISDGVFSMDGDIANIPRLIELAKKYNAMTYIDDAHATGILGPHGRGTEDYFGIEGNSDFVMGTFTKAFGGVGGYIATKKEVIDYLKITARSFIFTAPIAPPVAYGLIEAIKIVKNEPEHRKRLLNNAEYIRNNFVEMGFDIMNSKTQIIPVLIGDEAKAVKVSEYLLEQGVFAPVARWPAVPKKTARIRFAMMSGHSREQMDYLLEVMKKAKQKFKF